METSGFKLIRKGGIIRLHLKQVLNIYYQNLTVIVIS
jgi:hypothetical protein